MSIRRERFVVGQTEVRAVARADSSYTEPLAEGGQRDVHRYTLEIYLFDQGSIFLEYDEDRTARDADFEAVAAVVP